MNSVKIKICTTKRDLNSVRLIRKKVFVQEQCIFAKIVFDKLDEQAEHILLRYKNTAVGTARIRFIDLKAKLERIAVLKDYRSKGLGKKLIKFAISYCKKKIVEKQNKKERIKEIYMHAQYYLKDYYKKLGFKERGKPFKEANILHIDMYYPLK